MKTILLTFAFLSVTLLLGGCSSNEKPLTEAEQAEEMGMTQKEYKETKEAAARMNMTMDEHMNMGD